MQIIGPDGTPIETPDQLQQVQMQAQQLASLQHAPIPDPEAPQPNGRPPQILPPSAEPSMPVSQPPSAPAPVSQLPRLQPKPAPQPIRSQAPTTTIDRLEREFEQRKQRELDQARKAGAPTNGNGSSPRVTGQKVGRNDDCPCGSGKKYKKCHGASS